MFAAEVNPSVRAGDELDEEPDAKPVAEYNSAEARSRDPSDPPATSTSPFNSLVAECRIRAVVRSGPIETVPPAASTISVEFRTLVPSDPPTIMTRPSANNTAAWFFRDRV